MAVRGRDSVTLATLPALTYSRMYYLLQESTLSPPAAPTSNPPASPWSGTEPAYVAGSTLTLYTCIVNVYGSVSHEWGQVQVSSSYEAAKQAYNLAYSTTLTVDGMRRVVPSINEPAPPASGWVNGDQWWQYEVEAVTGRNRLQNIWVWNGSSWAAFQLIADSVLVPSSVGNVLLADGAVDAMTIRGAQIFGGYIEAPVIASSDKLGAGANVLADPGFTSTVNTSWVASGFTGDAASRSQVDTITWPWETVWLQGDWAYPGGNFNHYMRNWGNVVATATLSPGSERSTGTILFPNLSWFSTTARAITAPYTFQNRSWLQIENPQGPGVLDPTFRAAPAAPAPLAGTARTTYLTNSQTVAVVAGERWNARLGFTRIPEAFLPDIAAAAVEVVNASTSAVLWSHSLSSEELRAGAVNAWWDVDFTGNVKYRVKFTYTAGGSMKFIRRPAVGNYATQSTDGVETTSKWTAVATSALPYSAAPTTVASGSFLSMPVNLSAKAQQVTLTSASFARVEPEKGWRLSEDGGLELFNSLGAKTGQLDGESNFLAGEFATAESGARMLLTGSALQARNSLDAVVGRLEVVESRLRLLGPGGRPADTPISAYFQATANIGTADSNYNVGTFVPLSLAEVPSQSSYASGALSPFLAGAHMVTVLESGIYTISVRSGVPVATTGRSFIQAWAGSLYGVQEFPNGSYNFSTGMTGQLLAGQEIKFNVYQQSGGTRTCTTRLWLTYHGPAT